MNGPRLPRSCSHLLLNTLLAFVCLTTSTVWWPTLASAQPPTPPAASPPDAEPPASSAQPTPATPPPAAVEVEPFVTENPFPHRIPVPDFPADLEWLNTSQRLKLADVRGKFVLLDFWTYCCINCIHVLPELKKLEKAHPNDLVVIGVHSAKFDGEKITKNIEEAILRYEIEHPVINDANHRVWNMYGVSSWPTMILLDPEGKAIFAKSGEFKFEAIEMRLKAGLEHYRKYDKVDDTPIKFDLIADSQKPTPLRFPGKVLADEKSQRLFISDSNNNRIVVTSLSGELQTVIGSGEIGAQDGSFTEASFDHPQGVALLDEILYVADTENHMLRKVDLRKQRVTTIAGDGKQARFAWPGLDKVESIDDLPERWVGKPMETGLNSPWALWIHKSDLYIAMAGPHQIWRMPLDESEIGPYAGNGREDIIDGKLVPKIPIPFPQNIEFDECCSFAQPSGLTSDGKWLYVADSEGSSIRMVPFEKDKQVQTLVGTADEPRGRLFIFGNEDGPADKSRFQHPLGVAFHNGVVYVADTYNNSIRAVDVKTRETTTVAGNGKPGFSDEAGTFDEPTGLSIAKGKIFIADTNNHAIRTLDIASGAVKTLQIEGLKAPVRRVAAAANPTAIPSPKLAKPADSSNTLPVQEVKLADGKFNIQIELQLPDGWKLNELAPLAYTTSATGSGLIDRQKLGRKTVKPAATEFSIPVTATGVGEDKIQVSVRYYYCEDKEGGVCKIAEGTWLVPVKVNNTAKTDKIKLRHQAS